MTGAYPRDLAVSAAVFGLAALLWATWAQAHPPRGWWWRAVLGLGSFAGIALAVLGTVLLARLWATPTAIEPGTTAFVVYVVVFWVELAFAVVLAILAVRAGWSDFVSPALLALVGLDLIVLAPALHQPFLFVPAVLLIGVAAWALFAPSDDIARSFWCGILGAPVFLAAGAWAALATG
ncbi:hypothetical protein ACFVSU_11175 [Microbacterium sp. NPDC058062]|uniref:hypothetical protein n=1 Tax=Microbacterium sp. NPDC058062 TaxID=3346320 RepID=UPI0036DE2F74